MVAGFFLLRVSAGLPERAVDALLAVHRHNVIPYYMWPQAQTYLARLNTAIRVGRLIVSLAVGSAMAAAAKGREMLVAIMLSLVLGMLSVAALVFMIALQHESWFDLWWLLKTTVESSAMILIGTEIVRACRLRAARSLDATRN